MTNKRIIKNYPSQATGIDKKVGNFGMMTLVLGVKPSHLMAKGWLHTIHLA